MATTQDALKNIYLFKDLDPKELEVVAQVAEEKSYAPGEEVFSSGQDAHSLYVIRMGTVKIFTSTKQGDEMALTTMGTGAHFGEMPFLDSSVRSATAQAIEPTKLIEINYEKLNGLLNKNDKIAVKFYRSIAKYLGGRLRNTTDDLKHVKEIKLKHF